MKNKKLEGKTIAILATDGFEQSELLEPQKAVIEAGGEVHIISPKYPKIRAWSGGGWSEEVDVDKRLEECSAEDYDGLILPGGVLNPDKLRMEEQAVKFVADFFNRRQKPVAAICHGPWLLIEAEVVKGRKMTSYRSLKKDLINAGADWVDEPVVVDKGLVTSRAPEDLPQFCQKLVEEMCEGKHSMSA